MVNEVKASFMQDDNQCVGIHPDYSAIGKIASDAHPKGPAYTLTRALTDHVITPLNLPKADDYDTEKPSLSAKAIWAASQSEYAMQLKLFEKHPLLGPMCDGLIAKQLERTPLPINSKTGKPIPITPKIATIAIKRALQHEARAAGTNISEFTLSSAESITGALGLIQEGRDNALIMFFVHLREVISSEAFNAIFEDDSLSAAEKAGVIRTWLAENHKILSAVDTIDLRFRNLTSIPPEISYFSQLQSLYLGRNQISAIPDSLGKLAQLQSLSLENNQISAIPDSLGNLAQLKTLDLYDNQISAIPDSLGNLAQLQSLYLGSNQISAIPDSLGNLAQLQLLYLENNQISAIPDSIKQLAQLQRLGLQDNQITSIPDSIGQLTQLQTLCLAGNLTALAREARRLLPHCSYIG